MKLKAKKLNGFAEKIYGLSGKTVIEPIYFETRFGIHTFGMKKNIDVVILDMQNRIKTIKRSLGPGKLFFWNIKYSRVLELPADKFKLKLGDKVFLISGRGTNRNH